MVGFFATYRTSIPYLLEGGIDLRYIQITANQVSQGSDCYERKDRKSLT